MVDAVVVIVSFVAGIAASKVLLSEASSVKAHVSAEIGKLGAELKAELEKAAAKV